MDQAIDMKTDTENRILQKFGLAANSRLPIEVPNFGRQGLAELFAELDFKRGAEIGVREGEYSEVLCKAIPGLKLYGIDPYVSYKGYRDNIESENFDAYLEMAKKRLAGYDYEFVRKFSVDALADFDDQSLDFVYIDGNHDFKNCTDDIVGWSKKVRYGGIVSGHDFIKYRRPTSIHCYEVVTAYTAACDIKPWFITSSKVVKDGREAVEARSWFWVNEPITGPQGHRE